MHRCSEDVKVILISSISNLVLSLNDIDLLYHTYREAVLVDTLKTYTVLATLLKNQSHCNTSSTSSETVPLFS